MILSKHCSTEYVQGDVDLLNKTEDNEANDNRFM